LALLAVVGGHVVALSLVLSAPVLLVGSAAGGVSAWVNVETTRPSMSKRTREDMAVLALRRDAVSLMVGSGAAARALADKGALCTAE